MSFLRPVMDLSTMVERDTSAWLGQLFSQEGTEQSNQGSLLLFFHASISDLNLKVSRDMFSGPLALGCLVLPWMQ